MYFVVFSDIEISLITKINSNLKLQYLIKFDVLKSAEDFPVTSNLFGLLTMTLAQDSEAVTLVVFLIYNLFS